MARALAILVGLAGCAGPAGEPSVAVGLEHACARWEDGAVTCWGGDEHGQRGAALDALPPVGALDAGGNTTCVIVSADGSVWCFGQNHRGQLGDGTFEPSATPRRVAGLPPMIGVSVGFAHACAWAEDGTACCWGWNGSGQVDPDAPPGDVLAPACRARDARAVIAGFDTTCAIDRGDRLACSGGHDLEAEAVRAVAIGADHVCALTAGALACHGAEPGGAGEPLAAPLVLPFAGGALAAGAIDHLCVTDARGALYCMGKNEHGELGDGTFVPRAAPAPVRGLEGPVSAAGVGDRHSCAVAGGRVWCWGWNDRGQLGDDGAVPSADPVVVERPGDAG